MIILKRYTPILIFFEISNVHTLLFIPPLQKYFHSKPPVYQNVKNILQTNTKRYIMKIQNKRKEIKWKMYYLTESDEIISDEEKA